MHPHTEPRSLGFSLYGFRAKKIYGIDMFFLIFVQLRSNEGLGSLVEPFLLLQEGASLYFQRLSQMLQDFCCPHLKN